MMRIIVGAMLVPFVGLAACGDDEPPRFKELAGIPVEQGAHIALNITSQNFGDRLIGEVKRRSLRCASITNVYHVGKPHRYKVFCDFGLGDGGYMYTIYKDSTTAGFWHVEDGLGRLR